MSISQKLEKCYKNQIDNIKNEKNIITKIKMIGALVLDVGGRCIKAIADACGVCWRFAKKCENIAINNISIISNKNKCGRKKVTEKYPELANDIKEIIRGHYSTDPKFKSENKYVKLSIDEIMKRLINTGKYEKGFISRSCLGNLINELGYTLRKVQKTKPLKKIPETDLIFENVFARKDAAMSNERCALISIDTKDKVLIGPYSRKGKARTDVKACDHELTNNCRIPFGILDIKKSIPHFYNFKHKPTSQAIVDCIDDFWKNNYANTNVNSLAIQLDNGPDNSGVRTIFLKALVEFANKYKITIELIYYPPYHSKYNPIERLWARLEKNWNDALILNDEICLGYMKELIWKGNKAIAKSVDTEYEKGLTLSKKEIEKYENNYIVRNPSIKKYSLLITYS